MRRVLLVCAAITFAIACTDNITEPIPDRPTVTPGVALADPTVAFATTTTEDGLSISTDKDDYQPGNVVRLTGYGWPANDVLDIVLTDDPLTHDPLRWSVNVGADGTFHDATYVVDDGDVDVKFTLVATTTLSAPARSLTVQFTDGVTKITGSPLGLTFNVAWALYTNSTCTTLKTSGNANNNSGTANLTASKTTENAGNAGQAEFQKLTADANTSAGGTFKHWTGPNISTTSPNPLCVPGVQGDGTPTYTAVYTASNLTIDKTHIGSFTKGENGTYSLTVQNTGDAASSGTVTVQDVLPSGLSFVSAGGTGWTCTTTGTPTVVTCTSAASIAAAGGSAPAITLVVEVGSGAAATVTNTATVAGGGEPAGNNGNNSDSDATTIITPPTNGAPVATNDAATTNEDASVEIDVLANDTDDGPASNLTVVSLTQPAAGTGSVALSSGNKKVTYTPPADFSGGASFTYKASDGSKQSEAATVTVTVNPVNDVPSFTKGSDQTVLEDAGARTVANWASALSTGPSDESAQTLSFEVTGNSNAALFSVAPAISPGGELTYTPAPNANGEANITLVVKDNGGTDNGGDDTSDPQNFKITVTPVNDAPSFVNDGDKTVKEGDPAQSFANWATNVSAGPSNESGQTLAFTVTNDNNALFTVQPAVSATGELTFTPAADPNGTAKITVTLQDNGGTDNGGSNTSPAQYFTISVDNVPPTITSITRNPSGQLVLGSNNQASTTVTVAFTDPAGALDAPYTTAIACGNGTNASSAGVCTYTAANVGFNTISATVTDKDGGVSDPKTVQVHVVFNWSGFFQPVDNNNLNVTRAGSAVPVKFNLGGNQGLGIFIAGSPSSSKIACDTQADQDTIEETVNAGGSSLVYDASAGQYVYVWKTDKAWVGQCRRLDVKLIDGTTHSATFKFKN